MDSLVTVTGVHLVGLFVAAFNIGGRPNGITERPVVRGGVLRGIAQDQRVDVTVRLERAANRADATVHHVRRCHNVGSCCCMTQCLFDQRIAGHIVQDIA